MLIAAILSLALQGPTTDLNVERLRPMMFGAFVVPDRGSIVIPPSGMNLVYDRVVPMRGEVGGATFEVTGVPGQAVEVRLPGEVRAGQRGSSAVLRELTAEARHVRGFARLAPGVYRIELDRSGRNTVHVGGRLDIARSGDGGDLSVDFWLSATALDEGTPQ